MSSDNLPATAPALELSPLAILDRAVANGANVDVLERLMALQERHEANTARKAFDQAMAEAKAKIRPIIKNRSVGFDSRTPGKARTDYDYEDLAGIAEHVDPILAEHGLSYRYRSEQAPDGRVTVTCIVSHCLGHFVETSLWAMPDTSGNKNTIQAIGSAVTYLQRYTLKLALGLAAAKDDDAASFGAASSEPITIEQMKQLRVMLDEVGLDVQKFCKFGKVACLSEIPASQYAAAVARIEEARAIKTRAAKTEAPA